MSFALIYMHAIGTRIEYVVSACRTRTHVAQLRRMASRANEAGTIITRVRHLLQTRVMKHRPLWLDVVEAFPPSVAQGKHSLAPEPGRPPKITYPEDKLRNEFHQHFEEKFVSRSPKAKGRKAEVDGYVWSLFEDRREEEPSVCDRFVDLKQQSMAQGDSSEEATEVALRAMRRKGVRLRSKRQDPEDVDTQDSMQSLKNLLSQLPHRNESLDS